MTTDAKVDAVNTDEDARSADSDPDPIAFLTCSCCAFHLSITNSTATEPP